MLRYNWVSSLRICQTFFYCLPKVNGSSSRSQVTQYFYFLFRRGGTLGIISKGRDVVIRVGHIGISREQTAEIIAGKEYKAELLELQKLTKKRIVIASVDKLSPLSGIKNKLIAFKELLEQYPKFREKLVLIQYCTPGGSWEFVTASSNENKKLVKGINSRFPGSVVYEEGTVSSDKRLALFCSAEILLVTALRDGFCLLPFEFMLTKDVNKSAPGTIILSEFAGCVTAMSSICRINPYNISEITDAMLNGIEAQQTNHRDPKFLHDLQYILVHDVENWLKYLIEDMKRAHSKNQTAVYLGAIDKKLLKAKQIFKNLQPKEMEVAYRESINRVILLDGEGTIMPLVSDAISPNKVVSENLLLILDGLCSDGRNSVYVLSGKQKSIIDSWFSSVKNLGLGAEYGYYFRPHDEPDWKIPEMSKNLEWSSKTRSIFLWYMERTDGSNIQEKDNSLVWLYKECDPEMGEWMANDLQQNLKLALAEYPGIAIVHGKGFVEVKPKNLQKGKLAASIISDIKKKKGNIDFIFSIGDDIVDEEMFMKVNSIAKREAEKPVERKPIKNLKAFTCTVGRKPSNAHYYVNDYKDTLNLLNGMIDWSVKVKISIFIHRYQEIDPVFH